MHGSPTKGLMFACAVCLGAWALVAACAAAPPPDDTVLDAVREDWAAQDGLYKGKELQVDVVAAVVETLAPADDALTTRLAALRKDGAKPGDPRWLDVYTAACLRRRTARLGPHRDRLRRIVFTKHYDLGGSHYAYTEGQSDAQAERHFRPGSALCLLEMDGPFGRVRTLIDDPGGVIRDPDVSYDGRRILFAWKKSDREDDYHLYEVDVAADDAKGEVRGLTHGLGVADYEAAYLPDGHIVFNSTRCVQIVDCWWTEVSNLYTCDGRGRYLRRLSYDQVHTNYPTVTPDGRVIYTRWDYSDRGQVFPQGLFQMYLDGTGQTAVYGNNSWFPTTILHARAIPGTEKIVCVFSGHHTRQKGWLGVLDPTKGREENAGAQLIAPVRETKAVHVDRYGQEGDQFQYPYPLDEETFLVTMKPAVGGRAARHFAVYWIHADGRRELLAWDPKISCNQSVLLAPRPKPTRRARTADYTRDTGVFYVQDVYEGPGLAGVPRGTVKRLRVVALDFRAAGIGSNRNGGPAGGALISTPPSCDNGAWDVKRVLGHVPVYEDGSACFRVPARTPVYFQALDARGHAVQTMRSWATLQPGEGFACVGCHESKNTAPPAREPTRALAEGPRDLEPFYGPPRGFSFANEIQPILDRHCTRCHHDRTARLVLAEAGGNTGVPEHAEVVLPVESRWRYTTEDPGEGWHTPSFDASAWAEGRAGFGSRGHTPWRTKRIWLRRTVNLPAGWNPEGVRVLLRHRHDEDVEVFINGASVFRAEGHINAYRFAAIDPAALRPGRNVVAVQCRQTVGGQFIDVGLFQAKAPSAPAGVPPGAEVAAKKAFSLLDARTVDPRAKRRWSDAYMALTQNGRANRLVNWVSAQSAPPMLPPQAAGAAKSGLITMLEAGHNGVRLRREEMDKIACWIDLLVPFCGDYTEAAAWSDAEKEKYAHFLQKRRLMEAAEAENIRGWIEARRAQQNAAE